LKRERGQGLVEGTLVLLVFFTLLLGVVDCGQVVFAHEALVERVRSAVRWGVVRPFDGTREEITNLVLYNQTSEPRVATGGYLGLKPANVRVRYQPATAERPDDETLTVEIINFESHLFSPLIARTIISPRPVLISAPMAYRAAQAR
jgi:TadE-like protein